MKQAKPDKPDRFAPLNFMFDIGFNKYEMTTSERLIYCSLWNHADPKGYCTLSLSRIATMTGLAKNTIKAGVNRLIKLEIIRVTEESTRWGQSRSYQLKHIPYKRRRKRQPVNSEGGSMTDPGVGQ